VLECRERVNRGASSVDLNGLKRGIEKAP